MNDTEIILHGLRDHDEAGRAALARLTAKIAILEGEVEELRQKHQPDLCREPRINVPEGRKA